MKRGIHIKERLEGKILVEMVWFSLFKVRFGKESGEGSSKLLTRCLRVNEDSRVSRYYAFEERTISKLSSLFLRKTSRILIGMHLLLENLRQRRHEKRRGKALRARYNRLHGETKQHVTPSQLCAYGDPRGGFGGKEKRYTGCEQRSATEGWLSKNKSNPEEQGACALRKIFPLLIYKYRYVPGVYHFSPVVGSSSPCPG